MALTSLHTAAAVAAWQRQERHHNSPVLLPAYHSPSERTTESKAIPLSVIERSLSVPSVDTHADAKVNSQPSSGCPFTRMLPQEIHLEILDHLEYPDVRAVKNVSQSFSRTVSKQYLERARQRWKVTLHDLDLSGAFVSTARVPCYTCIRLRDRTRFPSMPAKVAAAAPADAVRIAERKCIECTWDEVSEGQPVWVGRTPWAKCVKCHRRRQVYRWKSEARENYLCTRCGRLSVLWWRWPIWLFQAGECIFPWFMLAWLVMCTRQGPLQLRNGMSDGGNDIAHLIWAVTIIQEFFTLLWLRSWWLDVYVMKRGLTLILFWLTVLGWPWVISCVTKLSNEGHNYKLLAVFIKCSFAFCFVNGVCRLSSVLNDERKKWHD